MSAMGLAGAQNMQGPHGPPGQQGQGPPGQQGIQRYRENTNQNASYNNMPPPPNTNNPWSRSSNSNTSNPSAAGNGLALNSNPPNTSLSTDQSQNPLPSISSPTDALGTISSSQGLPPWVKGIAGWWAEGKISDNDFVNAIKFLVNQGIIKV